MIYIKALDIQVKIDYNSYVITVAHMLYTKAASELSKDIFWVKQTNWTCLDIAYQNYLHINHSDSLFSYSYGREWYFFTCLSFTVKITQTFHNANLASFQNYIFHISDTLEHLLQEVSFNIDKSKRYYASETFTIYLRKHAQTIAFYIQNKSRLYEGFI